MNLSNVFQISQDEPGKVILGHPSTETPITARHKSFYRLTTNRHGTYTIRLVVPLVLQPILKCREVKKSLGTKDFKRARMLALNLSSQFDLLVNFNMKKHITDFDLNNKILKELKVKFGNSELEFNMSDSHEKEAYDALIERMSSQPVATAPVVAGAPIPLYESKYLVSEVKIEYFAEIEKTLAPKTYSLYKREIGAYLDFATGGLRACIHQLNKETCVKYKQTLQKQKITQQTVDSKLSYISSFFTYLKTHKDYPFPNPIDGLKTLSKTQRAAKTDSYEPFTDEDLQAIFDVNNYQKFFKGNLARYYIPIISLYSGMRLEEIAQLDLTDVALKNGINVFMIRKENKEHQVKNTESIRDVPIHKKLIELGFLEYVAYVKKLGNETKVFFQLSRQSKGYGPAISVAFSEYLKEIEIKTNKKVFHSFRKTFNNTLKKARVDEATRCQIMGHKYESVNNNVYGEDYELDDLNDFVNMAQFKVIINPPA